MIPDEFWALSSGKYHSIIIVAMRGEPRRVYVDGKLSTWWRRLSWWFMTTLRIILGQERGGVWR